MASEAPSSSSGSLTPYADELASVSASASSPTSSLLLPWTPQENKAFELALSNHPLPHDTAQNPDSDIWDDIAASLPGRSPASVKAHFESLLQDILAIDSGLVPLPAYYQQSEAQTAALPHSPTSASTSADAPNGVSSSAGHGGSRSKKDGNGSNSKNPLSKSSDLDRRKGIPWTEEEHKSFLLGLAKFGKGDWRSISRNFVRTRTPTQVASHAQKYFIRLNSMKKDRRRSSIHDITSVNGDAVQTNLVPITGHGVQAHHMSGNPAPSFTEGNAYTAAVGQPVMASTVGTPVLISPGGYSGPMVSGAPLVRPIMPGPPVGVLPVAYTVGQPVPPS